MATNNILTPARAANPERVSVAPRPTRRAILGAVGLTARVALLGISAAPAKPLGISLELRKLLDAEQSADEAAAYHDARVYAPIYDRWSEACAEIPHYEFVGGLNIVDQPITYSTRNEHVVAMCKSVVKREGRSDREDVQDARRLVAGVKQRERVALNLRRRLGLDSAYESGKHLDLALDAAIDAVAAFPVTTATDLHAKMQRLMLRGHMECDDAPGQIAADIARLAAREA